MFKKFKFPPFLDRFRKTRKAPTPIKTKPPTPSPPKDLLVETKKNFTSNKENIIRKMSNFFKLELQEGLINCIKEGYFNSIHIIFDEIEKLKMGSDIILIKKDDDNELTIIISDKCYNDIIKAMKKGLIVQRYNKQGVVDISELLDLEEIIMEFNKKAGIYIIKYTEAVDFNLIDPNKNSDKESKSESKSKSKST
jgi:hypothetical protein